MNIRLRPFQEQMRNQAREAMRRGRRRILLVAPPGAGKTATTLVIIDGAVRKGKRALFLVAGRQLIAEFSDRLTREGIAHGVIMGGHPLDGTDAPVMVASIDTLASRVRRGVRPPPADLVIIDEADLVRADRFESVLQLYPESFWIGQTATPIRHDGQPLDVFEEMILGPTPRELVRQGYLSDIDLKAFVCAEAEPIGADGEIDLNALDAQLSGTKLGDELDGNAIASYAEYGQGRPALMTTRVCRHARAMTERANNERIHGAPVCVAVYVDGDTPLDERKAIIQRLATREIQMVVSVAVFGRGMDCPCLEVLIDCAPTFSLATYLQRIGRLNRVSPETGKTRGLILDHAGNCFRHGFFDDDRAWSLEGKSVGKRNVVRAAITICPKCFRACKARTPTCPECGASLTGTTAVEQQFKEREARVLSLEEARRERAERLARKAEYERLLKIQEQRGYKRGWATHRYVEKYGAKPSIDLKPAREVSHAS